MNINKKEIIPIVIVLGFIIGLVLSNIVISHNYLLIHKEPLNMNDIIPKGNVYFYMNGDLVENPHNYMTNYGKDQINYRVFNTTGTPNQWNYLAIGTGSQSGYAVTALNAQLGDRVLATQGHTTATYGRYWQNHTWTGISGTITEAGVFNAGTGSNMAFYTGNFTFTIGTSDTFTMSWRFDTSGTT